jgi:hypothetical protein
MTDPAELTDQALTVTCPKCLAAPGDRCVPPMGVLVHLARVEAWRARPGDPRRLDPPADNPPSVK